MFFFVFSCKSLLNTDVQNGGWSYWSSWKCSYSLGEQTRNRSCTNPPPSGLGRACSGNDWQTKNCDIGKLTNVLIFSAGNILRSHDNIKISCQM